MPRLGPGSMSVMLNRRLVTRQRRPRRSASAAARARAAGCCGITRTKTTREPTGSAVRRSGFEASPRRERLLAARSMARRLSRCLSDRTWPGPVRHPGRPRGRCTAHRWHSVLRSRGLPLGRECTLETLARVTDRSRELPNPRTSHGTHPNAQHLRTPLPLWAVSAPEIGPSRQVFACIPMNNARQLTHRLPRGNACSAACASRLRTNPRTACCTRVPPRRRATSRAPVMGEAKQ
jgi:hypothetical protein